jgi:hypothetical protein
MGHMRSMEGLDHRIDDSLDAMAVGIDDERGIAVFAIVWPQPWQPVVVTSVLNRGSVEFVHCRSARSGKSQMEPGPEANPPTFLCLSASLSPPPT